MEEQSDKKIQTVIRCTPHVFVTEDNKSTVFKNVACETIIEATPDAQDADIYRKLEYVPYSEIAEHCVRELDLPRKAFLSWGTAAYAPVDKTSKVIDENNVVVTPITSLTEFEWESGEEGDDAEDGGKNLQDVSKKPNNRRSSRSGSDTSQYSLASFHGYTFGQKLEKKTLVDGEAQTYIGVSPMVFDTEDDVAVITTEEYVQTDITFSPSISVTELKALLNEDDNISVEEREASVDDVIRERYSNLSKPSRISDISVQREPSAHVPMETQLSIIEEEPAEEATKEVHQSNTEQVLLLGLVGEEKIQEESRDEEEEKGSENQESTNLVGILKMSAEQREFEENKRNESATEYSRTTYLEETVITTATTVTVGTETKSTITEIAGCACSPKGDGKISETIASDEEINTLEQTKREVSEMETSETFRTADDDTNLDTDNEISNFEDIEEENTLHQKADENSWEETKYVEQSIEHVAIKSESYTIKESENIEVVAEKLTKDAEISVQKSFIENKKGLDEKLCDCHNETDEEQVAEDFDINKNKEQQEVEKNIMKDAEISVQASFIETKPALVENLCPCDVTIKEEDKNEPKVNESNEQQQIVEESNMKDAEISAQASLLETKPALDEKLCSCGVKDKEEVVEDLEINENFEEGQQIGEEKNKKDAEIPVQASFIVPKPVLDQKLCGCDNADKEVVKGTEIIENEGEREELEESNKKDAEISAQSSFLKTKPGLDEGLCSCGVKDNEEVVKDLEIDENFEEEQQIKEENNKKDVEISVQASFITPKPVLDQKLCHCGASDSEEIVTKAETNDNNEEQLQSDEYFMKDTEIGVQNSLYNTEPVSDKELCHCKKEVQEIVDNIYEEQKDELNNVEVAETENDTAEKYEDEVNTIEDAGIAENEIEIPYEKETNDKQISDCYCKCMVNTMKDAEISVQTSVMDSQPTSGEPISSEGITKEEAVVENIVSVEDDKNTEEVQEFEQTEKENSSSKIDKVKIQEPMRSSVDEYRESNNFEIVRCSCGTEEGTETRQEEGCKCSVGIEKKRNGNEELPNDISDYVVLQHEITAVSNLTLQRSKIGNVQVKEESFEEDSEEINNITVEDTKADVTKHSSKEFSVTDPNEMSILQSQSESTVDKSEQNKEEPIKGDTKATEENVVKEANGIKTGTKGKNENVPANRISTLQNIYGLSDTVPESTESESLQVTEPKKAHCAVERVTNSTVRILQDAIDNVKDTRGNDSSCCDPEMLQRKLSEIRDNIGDFTKRVKENLEIKCDCSEAQEEPASVVPQDAIPTVIEEETKEEPRPNESFLICNCGGKEDTNEGASNVEICGIAPEAAPEKSEEIVGEKGVAESISGCLCQEKSSLSAAMPIVAEKKSEGSIKHGSEGVNNIVSEQKLRQFVTKKKSVQIVEFQAEKENNELPAAKYSAENNAGCICNERELEADTKNEADAAANKFSESKIYSKKIIEQSSIVTVLKYEQIKTEGNAKQYRSQVKEQSVVTEETNTVAESQTEYFNLNVASPRHSDPTINEEEIAIISADLNSEVPEERDTEEPKSVLNRKTATKNRTREETIPENVQPADEVNDEKGCSCAGQELNVKAVQKESQKDLYVKLEIDGAIEVPEKAQDAQQKCVCGHDTTETNIKAENAVGKSKSSSDVKSTSFVRFTKVFITESVSKLHEESRTIKNDGNTLSVEVLMKNETVSKVESISGSILVKKIISNPDSSKRKSSDFGEATASLPDIRDAVVIRLPVVNPPLQSYRCKHGTDGNEAEDEVELEYREMLQECNSLLVACLECEKKDFASVMLSELLIRVIEGDLTAAECVKSIVTDSSRRDDVCGEDKCAEGDATAAGLGDVEVEEYIRGLIEELIREFASADVLKEAAGGKDTVCLCDEQRVNAEERGLKSDKSDRVRFVINKTFIVTKIHPDGTLDIRMNSKNEVPPVSEDDDPNVENRPLKDHSFTFLHESLEQEPYFDFFWEADVLVQTDLTLGCRMNSDSLSSMNTKSGTKDVGMTVDDTDLKRTCESCNKEGASVDWQKIIVPPSADIELRLVKRLERTRPKRTSNYDNIENLRQDAQVRNKDLLRFADISLLYLSEDFNERLLLHLIV